MINATISSRNSEMNVHNSGLLIHVTLSECFIHSATSDTAYGSERLLCYSYLVCMVG